MQLISKEITSRTLENAFFCVTKTIDKIMTGEIQTLDLIISKQLRMDLKVQEYLSACCRCDSFSQYQ